MSVWTQKIKDRRKYVEDDDPDDSPYEPYDPDNETENPASPPSVKKPLVEHEKLPYEVFVEELQASPKRYVKLLRIIQHIMRPGNSDRDLRELFEKLKAMKNQAGGGEETTCSFANTNDAMPRDVKLSYLNDHWYLRAPASAEDTEGVWIRPPEKWEENGRYYIFDHRLSHCAYYPLPDYFPLAANTMQIYEKMYSADGGGGEVMTYFPEYSVWAIWNGSSWHHQEEGFTPSDEYPLSIDLAWLKPEHYGKLVELLRQRNGGRGHHRRRRQQSRRRKGSRRRSSHRKKK